jgi:hypothetical protein
MTKTKNKPADAGLLTRDAIISCDDIAKEPVQVPEWKGHVYVRLMNGAERGAFEAAVEAKKVDVTTVRGLLVALCTCDADGNRIFEDADADALNRKSAAALDRIFPVAVRLNKLSVTAAETLEKN